MKTEKMEAISQALMDHQSEIQALFAMAPEDAAVRLRELGYSFTPDELIAYGDQLQELKKKTDGPNGELNEESLENVAGGGLVTAALLGVAVGYIIYSKW